MEDIRFNNLINLVDFFLCDRVKVLGSGSEGTCYKIGNYTYKLYNELYSDLLNNDIAIERLLKFRDIIIDNIYFIKAAMYYDNQLIGSVCEYASGKCCKGALLYRSKIDKLVRALNILKENIYELSKLGICIDDNFLGNVLYDGNNFKLIDTGSYFYYNKDDYDTDIIYLKNMKKIMKILFLGITDKIYMEDDFIFGFLWKIDSPYKYYLIDDDLIMNPGNTIIGIKNTIEEYIGYEIDTFSRCRKDLLKIKKRK